MPIALAADTISITVMAIVDNAIMLLIPGAMDAGLTSLLFWGALAVALASRSSWLSRSTAGDRRDGAAVDAAATRHAEAGPRAREGRPVRPSLLGEPVPQDRPGLPEGAGSSWERCFCSCPPVAPVPSRTDGGDDRSHAPNDEGLDPDARAWSASATSP